MAQKYRGRRRSPERYNPLSEVALIASRASSPALKGSAVLAASGGLVAAFAIPANAAGNSGKDTKDAVVAFPISRHQGVEGMAAYHRAALEAFAATQHLGSPPVVTVDGDRAVLRANLISTHVHHAHHARPQGELAPLFATGTFVDGEARRTPAGWRLSLLSFRLLWADGTPPPPTTAG